mmetsp:Transcript_43611/g.140020  ORF Transcript_43611/g.140020 Transcript_43611/m.140020 type:complete len:221 (+) Transcript_43611:2755-3417(+)
MAWTRRGCARRRRRSRSPPAWWSTSRERSASPTAASRSRCRLRWSRSCPSLRAGRARSCRRWIWTRPWRLSRPSTATPRARRTSCRGSCTPRSLSSSRRTFTTLATCQSCPPARTSSRSSSARRSPSSSSAAKRLGSHSRQSGCSMRRTPHARCSSTSTACRAPSSSRTRPPRPRRCSGQRRTAATSTASVHRCRASSSRRRWRSERMWLLAHRCSSSRR